MIGKQIRLERIFDRKTSFALVVPMDHGISEGPLSGITDIRETIDKVSHGGATAIVIHKGLVAYGHRGYGKDVGLIIHISASTKLSPSPNTKVIVTDVEEGIQLGADAISLHVNVGAEGDDVMLADAGEVVRKCRNWGMPLLAMMYPRGKDIKDPYDVEHLKHVAVARALSVDRRVVRATAETIHSNGELSKFFSFLRPLANLKDAAPQLGWSTIEISTANADQPGILADVSRIIADAGISIRQAIVEDPDFTEHPKLYVVTASEVPADLIPLLKRAKGVSELTLR